MFNDAWLAAYQNRYDWAFTAYNKFHKALAPELQSKLPDAKHVTVAVYGATQVGKTTLILELLGIDAKTDDEAGSVLRGGQALGKSATARPIRYGVSRDDHWYISGNGPYTADQACDFFKKARHRVEQGSAADAETILDVRLPQRLFKTNESFNPSLHVDIIDVPGIHAHNEKEREVVARLAQRYVAAADLVLLVGKSDSLGFLNENDLELDVLAHWWAQPRRFRIVLTYGYSPDSLRRDLETQDVTVEGVRKLLLGQMATHDYHVPTEFHDKLYVMEIGDSLAGMAANDDALYQKINPINEEFKALLTRDIEHSVNPLGRVRAALEFTSDIEKSQQEIHDAYGLAVNNVIAEVRDELQKKKDIIAALAPEGKYAIKGFTELDLSGLNAEAGVDDLMAYENKLSAYIKGFEDVTSVLGQRNVDISGEIKLIQDYRKDANKKNHYPLESLFDFTALHVNENTVSSLRAILSSFQRNIPAAVDGGMRLGVEVDGLKKLDNEIWSGADIDEDIIFFECKKHKSLREIEQKLKDYMFDFYLFDSSFQEDKRAVFRAITLQKKQLQDAFHLALINVLYLAKKTNKEQQDRLSEYLGVIERVNTVVKQGVEKLAALKERYERRQQRMLDAMEMVDLFRKELHQSYCDALESQRLKANDAALCAEEKLLAVTQLGLLMGQDVDDMFEKGDLNV